MFDQFVRRFWQALAMLAALAIGGMVVLAAADPDAYNVIASRLLRAAMTWIELGLFVGIAWAIFRPKKGG